MPKPLNQANGYSNQKMVRKTNRHTGLRVTIVIVSVRRSEFTIILFLLVSSLFGQSPEDEPIKVNTILLNVPVIVSDKAGKNVAGLTKDDFRITSGGELKDIAYFSNSEMPLNVAIVLDITGSVGRVLPDIKKAAKQFVSQMGANDKCMLMTFGDKVIVQSPLISDKKQLDKRIDRIEGITGGIGLMNQAILDLGKSDYAKLEGRKAIIVLTDAGEINASLTARMLDELIEGEAVVYPIFYPTPAPWFPRGNGVSLEKLVKETPVGVLSQMARLTGGRLLVADGTDFTTQFQAITDELKKMYVLGFYPDEPSEGKSKPIGISTARTDLVLRLKAVIRRKPELKPAASPRKQ